MAKKPKDPTSEIPHERPEPRPDFTAPPPREKLPDALQKMVDDDDDNDSGLLERIYDGT
jgi:fission process protein 1